MKRVILVTGAVALWVSLCTSCYFATKFIEVKAKCKTTYEYIDLNSNNGTSDHCYNTEDGLMCRHNKNFIRVNKFNKYKECR